MKWKFTIRDRNNAATAIKEPTGWDSDIVSIQRDEKWHGIFFTKASESLQYFGTAAKLLHDEYELYGVQGIMFLDMEERCGNVWELADTGKFIFGTFDETCGDKCFAKCAMETTGDVPTIRNRVNQKVNLDTLKSFNGITNLPPYANLPLKMLLPSKGILLMDKAENAKSIPIPVDGAPAYTDPGSGPFNNSEYGMVSFGMDNIVASEIGGFNFSEDPFYTCVLTTAGSFNCPVPSPDAFWLYPAVIPTPNQIVCPLNIAPVVNYSEGFANYGVISDVCDLDINVAIGFENVSLTVRTGYVFLARLPKDKIGNLVSDYEWINVVYGAAMVYHDPAFVLNEGDRIYLFIGMYHFKTEAQTLSGLPAFKMSMIPGSYFHLESLTHSTPTVSKIYMVNEALSRVTEAITDDRVRVYSDYFGRPDSQPYQAAEDGCGSLEGITNGIRIRRAEDRIPGSPQEFAISLQDMFEGLNPIHNIGMGLEPDPARNSYSRMRVEPWRFFYNDDVILTLNGINTIQRKCSSKNIFSTFQFGFNKWEAEEYNGLDEFLTKRFYRTNLSEISNDFVQISKFVASGYAWEITRRKGNQDSKDWRYDNDTFIVCCKRAGFTLNVNNTESFMTIAPGLPGLTGSDVFTIANAIDQATGLPVPAIDGDYSLTIPITSGGVTTTTFFPSIPMGIYQADLLVNGVPVTSNNIGVDLGNIDTPTNIIDPATIYNWRITPVRNAMRWMNRVLMSYQNFDANANIIFSDGDGNYFASGKIASADCRLENQVIAENITIDFTKFEHYQDCAPFLEPDRIVFDYPFSTRDYKAVRANPYGLIAYNGCKSGFGHIDLIKYDRSKGMANFNLIPKIIIA